MRAPLVLDPFRTLFVVDVAGVGDLGEGRVAVFVDGELGGKGPESTNRLTRILNPLLPPPIQPGQLIPLIRLMLLPQHSPDLIRLRTRRYPLKSPPKRDILIPSVPGCLVLFAYLTGNGNSEK